MANENYPDIEVKAESPDTALPTLIPENSLHIFFGGKKTTVDISAALTVEDVKQTLLTIFNLSKDSRILVKRIDDGAIVVPGPKLPPGDYAIEEINGQSNL